MKFSRKMVLLFIAVSLIFSLNAQNKQNTKIVGKIGTKTYSYNEFNQIFTNYLKFYEDKGTKLTPDKKKELNNQCWEELIARQVYDNEIKNRKINFTDQQLYNKVLANPPAAVKSIADLKTNNKFDKNKFKMAMDKDPAFKKNVLTFVRDQYVYEKLFNVIKAGAKLDADSTIHKNWKKQNNKGDGKVLVFDFKKLPPATISDEEANTYYKSNYETFKRNPIRKYKYLKIANAPSVQDTLNAKATADSLYKALIGGANFEELATKFSEDPGSGKKGGDLGFFGRGAMVPEFDKASFETAVGQISQPVKTKFGYHIIKVFEKRNNEQGKEEVKASHILVKFKTPANTITENKNKSAEVFKFVSEKGITAAEAQFKMTAIESPEFGENDAFVQGIGNYPELYKFAFANKVGTVHELFQDKRGDMFILQISDSLGVHYASFDKEKANIVRLIQKNKRLQAEFDYANNFFKNNPKEKYIEIAQKDTLINIIDFKDVNEDGYLPKLGNIKEVKQAILNAKSNEFTPVIKTDKSVYLVYVSKRQYADDQSWLKVKKQEIKNVKDKNQNDHLNKWYGEQKNKMKIEDNRKDFYQL